MDLDDSKMYEMQNSGKWEAIFAFTETIGSNVMWLKTRIVNKLQNSSCTSGDIRNSPPLFPDGRKQGEENGFGP